MDVSDVSDAVALGADDPREARARTLRIAGGRAAADVPAFLDGAALRFAEAGQVEQAAFLFGRAREVEDAHHRLFGLDIDTARVQRTLVEFVPHGVITATLLHDHLRRLAMHPEPAVAHEWARAALGAFLDAGVVPYPNVVADLLPVARAAGVEEAEETGHIAARLLRGGLLARAPLPVWEAVEGALRRLAGDPEFLDLLIAARPDLYDDPETRAEHHRRWLLLLGLVDAGRRLSRRWLVELGAQPAAELMRLAGSAGDRVFPSLGRWFDPDADPLTGRRKAPLKADAPHWTSDAADFTAFAAKVETDRSARAQLAAYAEQVGRYDNVDYPAVLTALWARPPIRRVLTELTDGWKAECAAGDLLGLERSLPWLTPLAATASPVRDALADVEVTDPVDALWRALRAGVPEELRFPNVGAAPVTVVLHEDHLTLGVAGKRVEVHGPGGTVRRRDGEFPGATFPWHDGGEFWLSRLNGRRPETYRLVDGGLEVPDGAAAAETRWPRSPAAVEVTFPGADSPVLVTLDRGLLSLVADGRPTVRVHYDPVQGEEVMPPPGFWPHLSPTDPAGSAALRRVDRADVARLVDAALVHPKELEEELPRVLPDVTDPRLLNGVAELARRAAACLFRVLRLHDALGTDHPAVLPARLRTRPDLRPGRSVGQVVAVRYLAEVLEEAAGTGPAYDTPHPVGRVELPETAPGVYFPFGALGGKALLAAMPWTAEYARARLLDTLAAWGNTPWGDGSGRWRRLWFAAQATQDPVGRVWRTPGGAMIVLSFQNHPHKDSVAVEYSPDGAFRDFTFPGWHERYRPKPQGWGGADRIARLLRLIAERGPAPYDVAAIRSLAERTGLPVPTAASAACGYPFTVGRDHERSLLPPDVEALFQDPETGGHAAKTGSWQLDDALREVLMPDDPEDLWVTGIAVDKAVAWWNGGGRDEGH
ncbi:hypothetical protein [Actinomadura litoris]|uniref:Uncharacterized protein n=1 Tax=Actinomadura litoris TaxID=2678616 RepID=A0A7K1LDF5_9ACTN|nr:hypothetical protein [Actinomadura litoris]MUN42353.1 hypothetical protein [Actinomadura litoris]